MSKILHGDSKEVLKTLEAESIDALISDPPYALGFMGKAWDKALPDIEIFRECFRTLKPGAFAFVMSAPRSDVCARMMLLLEDAGFEIGFTPIYWTYASGFPKAMNIGKMVDKRKGRFGDGEQRRFRLMNYIGTEAKKKYDNATLAKLLGRKEKSAFIHHWISGNRFPQFEELQKLRNLIELPEEMLQDWRDVQEEAEREVVGKHASPAKEIYQGGELSRDLNITIAQTPEAKALDGSYGGFQPKPAVEVVIVAMKPLSEKTYVDQALKNGKGITWLDNARIPLQGSDQDDTICTCQCDHSKCDAPSAAKISGQREATKKERNMSSVPANVAMPTSEKTLGILPEDMSKITTSCSEEMSEENTTISLNTSGSGKKKTAQSQGGTKSTIETTTNETIDPKTCSCLLHTTIGNSTTEGTRSGGRFPANILVSDDVLNDGVERKVSGAAKLGKKHTHSSNSHFGNSSGTIPASLPNDSGSYSRYFSLDSWWENKIKDLPESVQKTFPFLIVPKAAKSEKNAGVSKTEGRAFQERKNAICGDCGNKGLKAGVSGKQLTCGHTNIQWEAVRSEVRGNSHPTVKPLTLMSYLITLATRPGDVVLDPFLGSGTTAVAAKMLGRECIGCEREEEYVKIAEARIAAVPAKLL